VKDHSTARHPGPWRVMQVDSEVAGIFVALGTLIALIALPLLWAGFHYNARIMSPTTRFTSDPTTTTSPSATRVTGWIVGSIKMKRLIVADSRTRKEPGFSKMCLCHV